MSLRRRGLWPWPPKAKTSTFVIGEKDACGEIMSRRPSLLRLRKEMAADGRTAATEDEEKKGERERERKQILRKIPTGLFSLKYK